MFRMPNDIYRALAQARKATHRGDLAAAKEWTSLVERHIRIAERHIRIAERHEALLQVRSAQVAPPKAARKPKDPTREFGYINPWVWPTHWTPEQIAEAERGHAEEQRQKAAASQDQNR